MLLLKEEDINSKLKTVLDKILNQLKNIKSVLSEVVIDNDENPHNFEYVSDIIKEILDNEQSIFVLESYFGNDKKYKLEKLSSIIKLSGADIKVLEENYSMIYSKKFSVKNYEEGFLKEFLGFNEKELSETLSSFSRLINVKGNDEEKIMLLNYLIKYEYANSHKAYSDFITEVAKPLQIKFISSPKYESYNNLFGLKPINEAALVAKDDYNGIMPIYKKINKTGKLEHCAEFLDGTKCKDNQITASEAYKNGFLLDKNLVENYAFFKFGDSLFAYKKTDPIIDATFEDLNFLKKAASELYAGRDSEKVILETYRDEREKGFLQHGSMVALRNVMLLKNVPKWSCGSVLKYDAKPHARNNYNITEGLKKFNSFIFLATPLNITSEGIKADIIEISADRHGYYCSTKVFTKEDFKSLQSTTNEERFLFYNAVAMEVQFEQMAKMSRDLNDKLSPRRNW